MNERERKGKGEKRKQETLGEPYFARSSTGVQILNRILDECISLTRLRPVSTECCWKRKKRSEGWELRRREERERGRFQRDNKSVLSSATMGRMGKTERRV